MCTNLFDQVNLHVDKYHPVNVYLGFQRACTRILHQRLLAELRGRGIKRIVLLMH